jgi:Rod binding domain-containing protein
MLGQMFDGVKASTFGGGEGEDAFKSFLTDAFAKSMTRHGGVGLSKTLSTEMLKMQGLS